MYYQCIILPHGHKDSDNFRKIAPGVREHILLRTVDCRAEVLAALDKALAANNVEFPLVMLGQDVIGMGGDALSNMLTHIHNNPHVHWEASEGEDAI